MSYDVTVGCSRCGEGACFNYTSNLGGLFRLAIKGGIKGLHGKSTKKAAKMLKVGLRKIDGMDEETLSRFNPDNSWGNHRAASAWLRDILTACEERRGGKVSVWA